MATLAKIVVVKSFEDNYGYGYSENLNEKGLQTVRRKPGEIISLETAQKYHPNFIDNLRKGGFVKIEFYEECPCCKQSLDVLSEPLAADAKVDKAWIYGKV